MVQSQRIFAVVAVMLFAAVGCQKGTSSAAKGNADSSAASTASAGDETQAKEEKSPAAPTAKASAEGSERVVKRSTLTEADDGVIVELRVGQILTLVLGANHEAGLSWNMANSTVGVIVPEGKPVYAAKSGKAAADGSTGTETWRFRAAKPGEQTVRLEYRRDWQQAVTEQNFHFTARVR